MADLLAAEQTELTQAQRIIAALENQGVISTSTLLLARHERIFDLPTNPAESLEVRRTRLLVKLNTHGTTTVQAIKELIKIVTGREGDVVEHFEEYSFSVIVHLLFSDETTAMQELIQQIEGIKPAHLLFDTTAAVEPVRGINRHHHSLHGLNIHVRDDNLGITCPRFNGWNKFGREIIFGSSIIKGLKLYFLAFALGARNRQRQALHLTYHLRWQIGSSQSAGFQGITVAHNPETIRPRQVEFQTGCRNTTNHLVTLTQDSRWTFSAEHQFDGTRRFNGAEYTKEDI